MCGVLLATHWTSCIFPVIKSVSASIDLCQTICIPPAIPAYRSSSGHALSTSMATFVESNLELDNMSRCSGVMCQRWCWCGEANDICGQFLRSIFCLVDVRSHIYILYSWPSLARIEKCNENCKQIIQGIKSKYNGTYIRAFPRQLSEKVRDPR